jgi:uncharacterized protein YbjT (DUF2867 family)
MLKAMRVVLFGATGMIGQGVLRECLVDPGVELVLAIGRTPSGAVDDKLRELVHSDLSNYSTIASKLPGFDACFFCLGVSSSGMQESEYDRITYGITIAAAETLCRLNPAMTFIYVSGAGTDSSERGRTMWARIKGKTENALLRLPFAAAYMFRPGIIQPLDGIQSKTRSYRIFYSIAKPLLPMLRTIFPDHILTTRQMGRAMLNIVRRGYPKRVLENKDIRIAAARSHQV